MVQNNIILVDNEKYQKILKFVENVFLLNLLKDNPIPLLCEYCGNDFTVGLAHYSYLKELLDQTDKEIYLVYMRYVGHEPYHYNSQQGIDVMKEMHQKILEFSNKYFSQNLKN